jgi:hypothetical protein
MAFQSDYTGHWMGEDGTDYGDNEQAARQGRPNETTPGGSGVTLPSASASAPGFDLNAFYLGPEGIGRAPDKTEIDTDTHTINSYGVDAFKQDFQKRRAPTNNRTADSQSAAGNTLYGSGTNNALNIPWWKLHAAAERSAHRDGAGGSALPVSGEHVLRSVDLAAGRPDHQSAQRADEPAAEFGAVAVDERSCSSASGELSSSPGYSPEERALLNTQAFEPIEAQRQAAQKRVLERASMRGILPSSGLVQDEYATNDRSADQLRTVANRDLTINEINKRQADLGTALQLGQAATAQDQSTRTQALSLATLLYQLPIQAQNQALAVINGTGSPQSLLPYVIQLAQAGAQNNADAARQAGLLAGLFQ